MGIGYLWRPTETSYMLAISQQLSNQADDEGEEGATGYHQQGTEFELDDLSLLSHSDNEGNNHGEIDDSFELEREPTTGTSTTLPPNYEELDDKTKKSSVDEKKKNKDKTEDTEGNNTLFELGEESD